MSEHSSRYSDDVSVGDDRIRGAKAIGIEIKEKPHTVYYLWKLRRLRGVYKEGNALVGSKSAIRKAHFSRAARAGK
jgi:hypothetical protein